jgi:DNA polymerase IV
MELPINYGQPLIMHIDLNSCYAIIEQQANRLIRRRPVVVAAYDTPRGMIIASSYEAKALGIKLGLNVQESRQISKEVIVLTPDPPKYKEAHKRFEKVLLNYTSEVIPKSIDEFIVDFRGSEAVRKGKSLKEIGYEIKEDIKEALGEYVTVNVGIATNRFLAKLAAGLHKPDGLDVITGEKLREVYSKLALTDLPGISYRYEARLNNLGIYTPQQFLDAPVELLRKRVFKSINGLYWHLRLRGHEVDNVVFSRKSVGQQYALKNKTKDLHELSRLIMKLSEKCGRRMRKAGLMAGGVHLWLGLNNHMYWAQGKKLYKNVYSTQDIFMGIESLLKKAYLPDVVTNIGVTVFNLSPATPEQLGLFDDSRLDTRSIAKAADEVNNRYGEYTLVPALMANMKDTIIDRVPFGSIRDL